MAPETLRLILIVLGVVVIGAIFLFGNPDRRSRQANSKRASSKKTNAMLGSKTRQATGRQAELPDTKGKGARDEDRGARRADDEDDGSALQQELQALGSMIAGDRGGETQEKSTADGVEDKGQDARRSVPRQPRKPAGPPPQHIVTLLVSCGPTRPITGVQLLDAAIKAGLVFGENEIFHRTLEGDDTPVFSMANMVKPGHFDRTAWNSFETPGVMLFMTLPGPMGGLDAWDSMLATAQRLAELLSAEILDEQRTPLSRQRIAQIRDTMRDYDRRRDQGKA